MGGVEAPIVLTSSTGTAELIQKVNLYLLEKHAHRFSQELLENGGVARGIFNVVQNLRLEGFRLLVNDENDRIDYQKK